ncbi:MAG TPA: hypothetical protein PL048_12095 [Leptospiraceae bacterium]|nr:hypothetical protein [Leptospiraceae bacterium]HMY69700.1 hypothetical protein [Leptospiraceae bacterium]HMZ59512.1 hypothetical protein [Leptospiraceae bacterium]HNF13816.1 hypothetical protein [Leptospiraceae bacterium]HNF23848.1 hypothetical protein [Leptospiraceae bacterium]
MMDFLNTSDKKSKKEKKEEDFTFDFPDNLNQEFSASLHDANDYMFGKVSRERVEELLNDAGIFSILERKGFKNHSLEISLLSILDNRIYIRNEKGEILVHMRLKSNELFLKKIDETLKLIYIDWLMTQNPNQKNTKKELYEGQEFSGLGIFAEISDFILRLSREINVHGVFNVPEYFHDAVLFHKNFRFLDPVKEGQFRHILENYRKIGLRKLSDLVHREKFTFEDTGLPYNWTYGEMFYSDWPTINAKIFDSKYMDELNEAKKRKIIYET